MKKLPKRILTATLGLAILTGGRVYASDADITELSTGLGIKTSIASSADAGKSNGLAQVDSTIAVITVDGDGVIVKCVIDAAQTRVNFDSKGVIKSDKDAEIFTKSEAGDAYNMKGNSGIGKEWYEQAEAFADWTIGKTPEEVMGLFTSAAGGDHSGSPDDPDLSSSVTISVGEFVNAIAKAVENLTKPAEVEGEFRTGLGIVTGIGSSADATSKAAGRGQVDSTIAAITTDADGVIVQCSIDAAQTRVSFNNKGKITSDKEAEILSKLELGDNYGMSKNSGIGKEWYEQAEAFSEWAIGKTIEDITGLKLTTEGDHAGVPDEADLAASVTITVNEFIEALVKAFENAK